MKKLEQIAEEMGTEKGFAFVFTTTQLHMVELLSRMANAEDDDEVEEIVNYASRVMSAQAAMIAKKLGLSDEEMNFAMQTASEYVRGEDTPDEVKH